MTTAHTSTVRISSDSALEFQKRLESLNKKAVRFGLPEIKILGSREVAYERKFENVGEDKQISYLVPLTAGAEPDHIIVLKHIDLEYPVIKLGDWNVIGKLTPVEGGTLTFSVSQDERDVNELMRRSKCPINCEHCKTERQRKDAYLLRNAQGDYIEVGRTCLEDFTGVDPGAVLFLAKMQEMITIVEGETMEYERSGRANALPTEMYLSNVVFLCETEGFVSTAKSRDTHYSPTYIDAAFLGQRLQGNEKLRERYRQEIDRCREVAAKVREWYATKPLSEKIADLTFENNVRLLLAADHIKLQAKHMAFAAAAVATYARHHEQERTRQQSNHQGVIGSAMTTELQVLRVTPIETRFGVSMLVSMADPQGNKFLWKTSACPQELREFSTDGKGRQLEASFKVKSHEEYRGTPQTNVTHLKVLRWLDREAPREPEEEALAEADEAPVERERMRA